LLLLQDGRVLLLLLHRFLRRASFFDLALAVDLPVGSLLRRSRLRKQLSENLSVQFWVLLQLFLLGWAKVPCLKLLKNVRNSLLDVFVLLLMVLVMVGGFILPGSLLGLHLIELVVLGLDLHN